jgi:hypothetical protein
MRKRTQIMLKITEYAPNERPPACARCSGTGFVYLWSIAVDGARTWFCDRFGCKLFWQDAGPRMPSFANRGVIVPEVQPEVSIADRPQLQPV